MEIRIRTATSEDAPIVHDMYGAYLDDEHVTFTIENPDVDHYREKIVNTLKKYPFLVAEDEHGTVLGYVNGNPLRPHDAYKWNVESTIILAPDAPRRSGIASALYEAFFQALLRQGYRHVYAVIVDTNEASIALHDSLGFETVGHFAEAGYKLGKWRGIVWMKKTLDTSDGEPRDPAPFQ